MTYKTSCEGCLFVRSREILPGIEGKSCAFLGKEHLIFSDGKYLATICPLNCLFMEIEKAMEAHYGT